MNGNLYAVFQQKILALEMEIAAEERNYNLLAETGKLGFISDNILYKIQVLEKRKDILEKSLDLIDRGEY